MSASGVDKSKLETPGRDILLVSGYEPEHARIVLSVPPGIEPRRVSVDAIEHWKIYREHPDVGAILHVHAWLDGITATEVNFPCGTEELADDRRRASLPPSRIPRTRSSACGTTASRPPAPLSRRSSTGSRRGSCSRCRWPDRPRLTPSEGLSTLMANTRSTTDPHPRSRRRRIVELTGRQQEIWQFLVDYVDRLGYPPTVREIGEAVGLASPSTVHAHLANLERAGLLRRDPTKPRALELIGREQPGLHRDAAEAAAARADRRRRAAPRRAERRGRARGAGDPARRLPAAREGRVDDRGGDPRRRHRRRAPRAGRAQRRHRRRARRRRRDAPTRRRSRRSTRRRGASGSSRRTRPSTRSTRTTCRFSAKSLESSGNCEPRRPPAPDARAGTVRAAARRLARVPGVWGVRPARAGRRCGAPSAR